MIAAAVRLPIMLGIAYQWRASTDDFAVILEPVRVLREARKVSYSGSFATVEAIDGDIETKKQVEPWSAELIREHLAAGSFDFTQRLLMSERTDARVARLPVLYSSVGGGTRIMRKRSTRGTAVRYVRADQPEVRSGADSRIEALHDAWKCRTSKMAVVGEILDRSTVHSALECCLTEAGNLGEAYGRSRRRSAYSDWSRELGR